MNSLSISFQSKSLILSYLSVQFQPMSLSLNYQPVQFHALDFELSVCPVSTNESDCELSAGLVCSYCSSSGLLPVCLDYPFASPPGLHLPSIDQRLFTGLLFVLSSTYLFACLTHACF